MTSRDRRHLHSFPTRRSSDLRLPGRVRGPAAHVRQPAVAADGGEEPLGAARPPRPAQAGGDEPHRLAQEDRKSTRLNSSHGYISYAVFCLKKKTQMVAFNHTP